MVKQNLIPSNSEYSESLFTIKEGVETPSVLDIEDNPYNLDFIEMERLSLANALEDCDMIITAADIMKESGRDAGSALEFYQGEGIQLVIKKEGLWTADLEKVLASDEVRKYIEEETDKTKVSLF